MTENPGNHSRQASRVEGESSNKTARIHATHIQRLEKALLPFEIQLQKQEAFRKRLGVKEVDQATYHRYIIADIERFEKQRMAFLCMRPDNPYGEDLRRKFKAHTGHDHYLSPLAYEELAIEDRFGCMIGYWRERAQ